MKIHPYLNFEGKTEEAFRFYEKILGGKLTQIHQFGSMPQEGGTITMPIADQFWGDYFGGLTDQFGINWMVNYSEPATRPQ